MQLLKLILDKFEQVFNIKKSFYHPAMEILVLPEKLIDSKDSLRGFEDSELKDFSIILIFASFK